MLCQRFDCVVDFGLAADFIEQQRLVGLQFAPDDAAHDAGVRPAQALRNHAQIVVESRPTLNRTVLARRADQVKPDFVKIDGEFVGRRLLADFIAEHSDVAAEWSRADGVLGFAAPESK